MQTDTQPESIRWVESKLKLNMNEGWTRRDVEIVKSWIHEWIEAEMEGLKKQTHNHADNSLNNLVSYWLVLIRSAMAEGTTEELIRTKAEAVNSFLAIGKSQEWIEEELTL
jgi:hypothetical protein